MVVALLGLLFFAAASVALVARAVAMPRVRTAETMGQIGSYGYTRRGGVEEEADSGAVRGALDDIAGFVGGLVNSKLGGVKEAELRNELMAAGLYVITPKKFLGYRVLCAVSVPTTWIWLAVVSGMPPFLAILGALVAVLAGWVAPMTIVRNGSSRSTTTSPSSSTSSSSRSRPVSGSTAPSRSPPSASKGRSATSFA